MPSILFSPFKLRDLVFKNRIVVSPMCQYSAEDGIPNEWHLVHLGSRAVGGAALVICEATGVSPIARISPADTGIWNKKQVQAFSKITSFIKSQNSIPAIQLAHAGRKASSSVPWLGEGNVSVDKGGWIPVAPSPIAFSPKYVTPHELNEAEIFQIIEEFSQASLNAIEAGFQVAEIHMAHGYLLNEFMSPLSNKRTDQFGGSLENRMRFPLAVATQVRSKWPQGWPVFVRISATDWVDGGWTIEDSVVFAKKLKNLGIDLIDCSSGGSSPDAKIKAGPGYQVPFSREVKVGAQIPTGAVGIITEAHQAEEILKTDKADLILMARELLRDPYWPLHAAQVLGDEVAWPKQYERAKR